MSGLFGLFSRAPEVRSLENPAEPLTSTALLSMLGGVPGDSGVTVNEVNAAKMSAVYRCVSLISSVSASLPLYGYEPGTKVRVPSKLLADPHPEMTPYELWKLTYVHRCLWGNAFVQKIRNGAGQVVELHPVRPSRVRVGRVKPSDANPTGKMFEVVLGDEEFDFYEAGAADFRTVPMTPRELMHLPGLGYDGIRGLSLVRYAAQGIGLALAAETYGAKLFGSGNLLSGLLTTDQRLDPTAASNLQERWRAMMSGLGRAHDVAVLDSGAKFQSLTMPTSDSQLLESRHFQISEASRYWGVPPFLMMQTEKSTSWGTGLEQQAQGWVTFDLHPQWLAPTEQRVTKELLSGARYARYDVDGLLRGDSKARAEYYRTMRELGVYNADDIRDREDDTPLPDGIGQIYLQPLNFGPLGAPPPSPPPATPAPTPDGGTGDGPQPTAG